MKKMKKIMLYMIVLVCMPHYVMAQRTFGNLRQMYLQENYVIEAVKEGMVVIKQQYQLKDIKKGSFHGKNAAEHFGETYSLALKINQGLQLTLPAVTPWLYDEDFTMINSRENRKYEPVLYESFLRSVDEKTFRKIYIESAYITPVEDSVLFAFDQGTRDFGFKMRGCTGEKNGILVVCHTQEPLAENDTTKIMLSQRKCTFNFTDSVSTLYKLPKLEMQNIVGGIWLVPEVTAIGVVTYYVSGVMVLTPEGEWRLCAIKEE